MWEARPSNNIWATLARVERYSDRMIVATFERIRDSAFGGRKCGAGQYIWTRRRRAAETLMR